MSELDVLEIMMTEHLVKDANVKNTAAASSSSAPIPTKRKLVYRHLQAASVEKKLPPV